MRRARDALAAPGQCRERDGWRAGGHGRSGCAIKRCMATHGRHSCLRVDTALAPRPRGVDKAARPPANAATIRIIFCTRVCVNTRLLRRYPLLETIGECYFAKIGPEEILLRP